MNYFLISSKVNNFQSKEFVLITDIFWQIFWRDNWQSLIVAIENFRYIYTLHVIWATVPLKSKLIEKPCMHLTILF